MMAGVVGDRVTAGNGLEASVLVLSQENHAL